jgi:hypothetical protein
LLGLVLGNDACLKEFGIAFRLRILVLGVGFVARLVSSRLKQDGIIALDIGGGLVIGSLQGR